MGNQRSTGLEKTGTPNRSNDVDHKIVSDVEGLEQGSSKTRVGANGRSQGTGILNSLTFQVEMLNSNFKFDTILVIGVPLYLYLALKK